MSGSDRIGSQDRKGTVLKVAMNSFGLTGPKWQMGMPTTWTLPYKVETEELSWKVNVVVELAEGPKGVFNFQLLVVRGANVEGEAT